MKLLALVFLFLIGSAICPPKFFLSPAQHAEAASISSQDADFSIVLFPDTQYYNSKNAYVFKDQANWVVAHRAALNIKMVIGLGDIIDGGGYPIDSHANVIGTCERAPSSSWQTQWQQAQAAVKILTVMESTFSLRLATMTTI